MLCIVELPTDALPVDNSPPTHSGSRLQLGAHARIRLEFGPQLERMLHTTREREEHTTKLTIKNIGYLDFHKVRYYYSSKFSQTTLSTILHTFLCLFQSAF